jgi:flagella basal body P-ring formation protein FlgA
LREAVEDYFGREFARYGGTAEVLFDRSDDHVLELTGPPLEFHIRREKSNPLGLCALEIDVIKDGKTAQQIPLVVRTALNRSVLTARRAMNQGAAIVAADVDLVPVTFTRLGDLGLDDAVLVLGQRAKRFIPAGTRIELEMLEPVPLVLRGQLITLISEVGGVRVVTTAKACANGLRGETIRVRSVDDNKIEFDAVVTGPGEARAAGGGDTVVESKPRLVMGGTP